MYNYTQTVGVDMGLPLGHTLSNIYMTYVENKFSNFTKPMTYQ